MTNRLEVSGITDTIKARINQIEGQLKKHAKLSDELERLRRALAHLEGEVRARVKRGREPATQRKRTTTAPEVAAPSKPVTVRAPRGENRAKILESLGDGPKTASEVANQTGINTGTASSTLTKLAKAGEVVKAERGYALPSSDGPVST
jgi:predicted Rossmann fold nucleotide-binding protein DprA/Smf involved in DNA uptake